MTKKKWETNVTLDIKIQMFKEKNQVFRKVLGITKYNIDCRLTNNQKKMAFKSKQIKVGADNVAIMSKTLFVLLEKKIATAGKIVNRILWGLGP